ncbi:putative AAA+ ATPase domain, P-loop containing nucleoside triphosphate hydrolase [Helianthus annuus]|nr:putative AAA+ ATPase domain, P-loop containing nucleoside triphosphate hydrolase [Helianthus annuus]
MSTVDIAVSVIAKLLEYTARPIIQPFGYILHHNRNINGLQTQISHLENTQFEVQQQVDVAQRNGEIVLPTVQAWLAKANSLATESDKFLSNQVVTNHNCISGSCPNLKLIYKISREAKKKSIAVNQVVEGGKFDRVSHPARLPPIWPSNDGAFIGELDGFESRKAQLRLMMEALGDDSVNIIGVYGMGGIGKTTFVEEVAKQAYARQLFDEMVMVVVSHKPNLRKLQGDLAEMLELNLKEEGEVLRTVRLRERLNQVKRILIILDDLWMPFDLRTIGIPQGNLHKGCKIILTSRSLDVCNAMSTQRNFHMDVLSQVESWNLFKKMAGDTVESSDLNPIATKVAKRCSGLPLAIVTVARALRHRSKYAWRDALRQLKSSTSNDVKGVYANVFASLELSFNFLKDEETKACFLLCSLFKEDLDISVEFLVRYGIGLRLFQDVHTLEEARDRVHTIVENLKACCLLLDSDVEDCFRMHDVTRDFLLSVACRGLYIFLEKMIPEYLESSNENKLGNYYAISMVLNNLEEFPIGIECPKLQLWRLEGSTGQVEFSVHGQSSQNQATLDELKNLSHLTTFETHIPDVNLFPKDLLFRNLVRFKLFIGMDISQVINYSYPKTLRLTLHQGLSLHGGIYKLLKSAQHLILDYSIIDYLEDLNSIVYDLRKGFKHLRCLEVYGYTGVESLIDTKIFPVLENLKVVSAADLRMICYDHLPDQSFCELRELMLSILPELTCLWVDPMGNVCLRNLRTIYVSDCHKLKDLVSQSTARDLSELQRLYVSSCEDLKVILFKDAGDSSSRIVLSKLKSIKLEFLPSLSSFCPEAATNLVQEALFNSKVDFPSLEELTLRELHSVNEIWPRQFSTANFRSLRILIIFGCENLVLVFPSYIQKMLQNLEILYIEWCDSVEEVCGLDEHDIHNENDASLATLPCVRDLILGKLPLLKHLWWNKDINPHAYTSLQNLNSLHLYECDGLIHLFSFCAMKSLVQLQELKVRSCKMMKTVFANEGDDGIIVLSELRYVSLEDLPELSSFCKGSSSLHFPSLDMIEIKSCPKMKAFVASDVRQEENLFNEKVALPNLQALYLDGLSSMIGIWHTELPDKSFNELQVLKVINCDQLLDLGPINMLPRLQIIEEIHIINCASLEQLFAIKHTQTHQNLASVSLIKLVDLVLRNLPNLRQIWWDRSKTPTETSRFQRLASVEVASCELLDCIFPVWVARGVPRLQKLKVESCTLVKAIVEYNGRQSEPDDIILPQVCSIELENLPNLVHFCTRMSELRWLSLKELRIMNCSKMGSFVSTSSLENDSNSIKVFFVEKVVFPSLEKLRIDNLECVNTLWHTDTMAEAFSQLSILEVRNCNNLVKLIPSSLLPRLQNLEELHVNQCCLLEMILEENSIEKVMFPKVHTVRLIKLPKVACFISGNRSFEWPNLERLVIEDCPTMKMFSLVGQIVPKLNAIEVGYGLQVWNGDLDSTIQHLFVS